MFSQASVTLSAIGLMPTWLLLILVGYWVTLQCGRYASYWNAFLMWKCCSHPQRSWGKVIFSVACVKNAVHGGSTYLGRYTSQAGTPPTRYTPGQVHTQAGTHTPGRYTPEHTSRRYASYWNAFFFNFLFKCQA